MTILNNRVKIKPVRVLVDNDWSKARHGVNKITMEVDETGEMIDYVYSNGNQKKWWLTNNSSKLYLSYLSSIP